MALNGHRVFYIILVAMAIAIALTQATAYYYSQQSSSYTPKSECLAYVCTLINFGNSTSIWYNETSLPADWNFYNVTVFITHGNLQTIYYPPPLNEHFVTAIDGITNSGQSSWTLWSYCGHGNWLFSHVGADSIKPSSGGTLAWSYENPNSNSPPIAGTHAVEACP